MPIDALLVRPRCAPARALALALALPATLLQACAPVAVNEDGSEARVVGAGPMAGPMPRLPSAASRAPWGGSDASRWRAEAVIANAVSAALNDAWSEPAVADVVVALPLEMRTSVVHPYLDGQSNASPSFAWWHASRPPVVATKSTFDGGSGRIALRFDRALALRSGAIELRVPTDGDWQNARTTTLTAQRDDAGDWVARLELAPGQALDLALVHPAGWQDWFPLRFAMPVGRADDVSATVPDALRAFRDGHPALDPLGVSAQRAPLGEGETVFARLGSAELPPYFQPVAGCTVDRERHACRVDDVHARYPNAGRDEVTAVGRGWTWQANVPDAPFKLLYTCFDPRQPDLEASAPDDGVPSGGGWHQIGDPAETIFNVLETGPVLVGYAQGNPVPAAWLPSGGFSYGLHDVAMARWLRPGEAFTVRRGGAVRLASGERVEQPAFHWFAFHQASAVCTEEWVHPYRPLEGATFERGPATLRLDASGGAMIEEGPLGARDDALLDYDPRRLATCRGPNWQLRAHYRVDGGAWLDAPIAAGDASGQPALAPAALHLTPGGAALELYIENTDDADCHDWDSGADHQNYRLPLR